MEDIRLGMEVNNPKFNQRRTAMVKFLAEMYNYRLGEKVVLGIVSTLFYFQVD